MDEDNISELMVINDFKSSPLAYFRMEPETNSYYVFEVLGYKENEEPNGFEQHEKSYLRYNIIVSRKMTEDQFKHFVSN